MLNHLNNHPKNPSRVVVLGAAGFVGSCIVRELIRENIPYLGLSRTQIDLLSMDAGIKLLDYIKPNDVLVICSAIAPCKNNAQLIENLKIIKNIISVFETVLLSQIIYISSDAVYSDDINLVTELSTMQPSSLHGMMHSARELMLKTSVGNIPLAILRPSLLYGIDDPHNGYGPNRFRRLVEEDKNIILFGNGEEKRDHIFIEDVTKIVCLTIKHRSKGVLNIATGNSMSFREIAETVVNQFGKHIIIQESVRNNPITHRYFDITACYKVFPHFHYTSFQDGVKMLQTKKEIA